MTLFRPGEVILVQSDQAAGYRTRLKYHVCVCGYRGRYFFVNSRSWAGSFEITNAEFPNLPNDRSFIACNTLLKVSDDYMRVNGASSVGALSREIVGSLIEHIENCDVMTDEEKEVAIDGLTGAL